jgi:hypothetical protein
MWKVAGQEMETLGCQSCDVLSAGGWWLVAGGWWLVAGGWWLVAGGSEHGARSSPVAGYPPRYS